MLSGVVVSSITCAPTTASGVSFPGGGNTLSGMSSQMQTPPRRREAPRRWWRWGCGVVVALVVLALVLGAVFVWRANDTLHRNITVDDQLLPTQGQSVETRPPGTDGSGDDPSGDGTSAPSGTAAPTAGDGGADEAAPAPDATSGYTYLKDTNGDGEPDDRATATVQPPQDAEDKARNPSRGAEGARNVLIVGQDNAQSDGVTRSDVMILAHMNAAGDQVTLVHFPRDLWVPIPGYGQHKLNWAWANGGAPLLVQTFQGVLDVPVDDVVITDFDSFSSTVDALGGVTVHNPQPSPKFPAETLRLESGSEALAFVRERKTLALGDMGRGERQMAVLSGVFDAATSASVAGNPNRVQAILDASTRNVRVSPGLSVGEIRRIGTDFVTGRGDVTYRTAPWAGIGWSPDGRQSIVVPDWAGIRALGEKVRTDTL